MQLSLTCLFLALGRDLQSTRLQPAARVALRCGQSTRRGASRSEKNDEGGLQAIRQEIQHRRCRRRKSQEAFAKRVQFRGYNAKVSES